MKIKVSYADLHNIVGALINSRYLFDSVTAHYDRHGALLREHICELEGIAKNMILKKTKASYTFSLTSVQALAFMQIFTGRKWPVEYAVTINNIIQEIDKEHKKQLLFTEKSMYENS